MLQQKLIHQLMNNNFQKSNTSVYNIASINVHGFGDKTSAIKNLIIQSKIDILCLQETWRFNLNDFKLKNYHVLHQTSMPIDTVITGRPYGGLGFIIKNSIKYEKISPFNIPNGMNLYTFSRVMSINLIECKTLLTNIYLPAVDSRLSCLENEQKFDETLAYFDVTTHGFSNQILVGDFNLSPFDKITNRHKLFQTYLIPKFYEFDLDFVDNKNYTYYDHHSQRFIDRVLTTCKSLSNYKICINDDIGSDHLPIMFNLNFTITSENTRRISDFITKINWQKATSRNVFAFKEKIDYLIKKNLGKPEYYNNSTLNRLLQTLEEAASMSMPKYRPKSKRSTLLPDWNETVGPYKKVLQYWNNILCVTASSHPNFNHIKHMSRLAKTRFKWALRKHRTFCSKEKNSFTTNENCYKLLNNNKKTSLINPPNDIAGFKPENQLIMWTEHYQKTFSTQKEPKKLHILTKLTNYSHTMI